ncbi:uncharacterized protein FTOL_07544 [Fusarium torulosum]|uniref:Uncharacterized protein n=1 Tax=Fusarium torulosum TaxID=33205 RepID=A0AAE8MC61_9HYPO|nr:uncharacterized protein FTOL_07544 [Fusarium torulosum]
MKHPGSAKKQEIRSTRSQYTKAPPGSMADTWCCTEIKPPAMIGRIILHLLYEPGSMPIQLPEYIYTYILADFRCPISKRYPVPVNDINFERTHKPDRLEAVDIYGWTYIHLLQDDNGTTVGAVHLHHKYDDSNQIQEQTKVELIAICKGWSSILRRYTPRRQYPVKPENRSTANTYLTEEKESVEQKERNRRMKEMFEQIPCTEKWDITKKDEQDCYHVLWIEWENGVAYRKS